MGKLSDDPLWNVPALTPPKGQKSDFDRPGLAANSIVILNGVWLSIMIIVVSLRVYTRQFITRQGLGLDDGQFSDFLEDMLLLLTDRKGFVYLALYVESECVECYY